MDFQFPIVNRFGHVFRFEENEWKQDLEVPIFKFRKSTGFSQYERSNYERVSMKLLLNMVEYII